MKNNTIALVGEWNTTNIGDRAIGLHAARYLLSFGFTIKLFALGSFRYLGDVANTSQLPSMFSASYTVDWQTEGFFKKRTLRLAHKHFPRMKFLFRFCRNYMNQGAVIKELSACKAVLVGGGALLDDDGLHFPSSLFLIKNVSKRLQLPIYCIGCSSSGKFSRIGKFILKDFMKYASVVAVRDASSWEVLRRLCDKTIYIFGDFALNTNQIVRAKTIDKVKRVALNVMHFAGDDKELQPGYEIFLTQLLVVLRERADLSVTLFTTGDVNDLAIANKINLVTGLSSPVFHPQSFHDIVTFFNDNDVVLCTRLHSAIMAIDENIPAIALWVKPKIKNFFHTIGLKDFCIQAIYQGNNNQMVGELLDTKLPGYFSLLNFDYFLEARDKVSKVLVALGANPKRVKEKTSII